MSLGSFPFQGFRADPSVQKLVIPQENVCDDQHYAPDIRHIRRQLHLHTLDPGPHGGIQFVPRRGHPRPIPLRRLLRPRPGPTRTHAGIALNRSDTRLHRQSLPLRPLHTHLGRRTQHGDRPRLARPCRLLWFARALHRRRNARRHVAEAEPRLRRWRVVHGRRAWTHSGANDRWIQRHVPRLAVAALAPLLRHLRHVDRAVLLPARNASFQHLVQACGEVASFDRSSRYQEPRPAGTRERVVWAIDEEQLGSAVATHDGSGALVPVHLSRVVLWL